MPSSKQGTSLWNKDFIIMCFTNFLIFASFHMLMPTFPGYIALHGANRVMIGLVMGIFTVSALLARPILGREMDRHGRRLFYLIGLAVFALSIAGFAIAGSILLLILIRLLQGAAWASASTASGAIVTDLVPVNRRMEGIGFFGLFATFSMAIAPALGLAVLGNGRYTLLFLVSAALAVASALVSSRVKMPAVEAHTGPPAALFERRALMPSLIAFFLSLNFSGISTFVALYAEELKLTCIGLFFTVYGVTVIAIRTATAKIPDKHGCSVVLIPGLSAVVLSMLLLAVSRSCLALLAAAALFGLGFGLCQPVLQALAVAEVPPNRRGAAIATYFSAFDIGVGLGSVILGAAAQSFGYSWMYVVSAGFGLAGLVAFLIFRVHHPAFRKPAKD